MECTDQRYFFLGGDPSKGGGVIFPQSGRKNWGISPHFRQRRTSFEILGKFVNKNAIKSDFWGDLCRSISKIFEKSSFLAKKYFYKFRNFRKYFYRGALTPLPKIALKRTMKLLMLKTLTLPSQRQFSKYNIVKIYITISIEAITNNQ